MVRMRSDNFSLSVHALQRMFERGITDDDVESVLESGKVIEEYPDAQPHPGCLMLGWVRSRPVHVVVATDPANLEAIVVTVYEPDHERWLPGFERRRST